MSKEQIVVGQKLDESITENEASTRNSLATGETATKETAIKETTTKEGTTKNVQATEAIVKEDTTEDAITKTHIVEDTSAVETKLAENKRSPEHDKHLVKSKSHTRFSETDKPEDDDRRQTIDNLPDDDSKYIRLQSEDTITLLGSKLKKSITDLGLVQIDDEDSDFSIESYIRQEAIDSKFDLFDDYLLIPDISEVSEFSFERARQSLKSSVGSGIMDTRDIGSFVNPLTGELEPDPDKEEEESEERVVVEVARQDSDYERWDEEDDDLLAVTEHEQDFTEKRDTGDGVFETFLDMVTIADEPTEIEIDYAALEKERVERQLFVITIDFISELIKKVVETCEYIDPRVILRQNLDKIQLIQNIDSKLVELDIEKKTSFFLNRKVVDYFKRKKAFRSILKDNPETVAADIQKLKDATAKLDRLMGRFEELKTVAGARLADLNAELYSKEEDARKVIIDFEDMIKKSLNRDNFEKLPQVVIKLLSSIGKLRDEVSEVRFLLIQKQHTFATLTEKLDKLEALGVGLSMTDFEMLQTQTQSLGKKIEERNSELNRLRIRRNAELHIMSHMKEKQKMLRSTITVQQQALDELQSHRQNIREHLFNLKLNRTKIRNELHELSYQGGLLDKPALMFDYDDTIDRLHALQNTVRQYTNKYVELQQKIQRLEHKCV